jgi:universal stress protein E
MQRFQNLLLVHEPGTRGRKARGRAIDLAQRNKAPIKLLEVCEPLPADVAIYESPDGKIDLQQAVAREREEALRGVAEEMAAEGVDVLPRVVFGTPFISIMREVMTAGHDLVLLTAEGDTSMREHLFGSTSRHMLRKCPCPVWVVRPSRPRKRFRVLAAVNPGETHPSGRILDRTVMEMASSLARMYNGELDVAHVWQTAPKSGRVNRKVRALWNEDLKQAAEKRVIDLLNELDLGTPEPRIHLPGGPTGLRLAEVAAERRSDIIVMGTLGRAGLRGLFMGNTAETVLQHIDASVLAVKPEGFVSPVQLD